MLRQNLAATRGLRASPRQAWPDLAVGIDTTFRKVQHRSFSSRCLAIREEVCRSLHVNLLALFNHFQTHTQNIPEAFRSSSSDSSSVTSPAGATAVAANTVSSMEALKGCRTVLAELTGLDFAPTEVSLYLALGSKAPRYTPSMMSRSGVLYAH